jgi:arylsulfatase A-like enzyme
MGTDRPNVILILIDDLGWRDVSSYGSSFYETPNIDQLGQAGLRCTDAYAAAPVCSPTRASLLSGKYPARVGVTQYIGGFGVGALQDVPYFRELPESEFSLARALSGSGYSTWHVGKWHLGPPRCWPENHGFDVNIAGHSAGAPSTYFSPYGIPTLTDGPAGEYLTDRLTDEAIHLLENAGNEPFFLNLWYYAVHTPIEAPQELVHKYKQKAAALGLDPEPITMGENMPLWHRRDKRVERRQSQSNPDYAAMIENLDTNIGRLLDALHANGKSENTIVIFTSDNGGLSTSEGSPTSNAPLAEGKGWMQDGGVRVPFIVSWPGQIRAGSVTDLPFTTPDLYPTILSLTGIDAMPHQHVDGVDLSRHWLGEPIDRGPIFWHYPHYSNQGGSPGAAVRRGRFKLIRDFETSREELFDLSLDISEATDLSGQEPAIAAQLSELLDSWMGDISALVPSANPNVKRMFENS